MKVEWQRILSGSYFDSDRHGNQLRVLVDQVNKAITISLYDFGEMCLEPPTKVEITQLANLISHAFKDKPLQQLLSEHIEKAEQSNQSVDYLMRIRKAFLALQDFNKYLSEDDTANILKELVLKGNIDQKIKNQLLFLAVDKVKESIGSIFSSVATFFSSSKEEDKSHQHILQNKH